MGKKRKAASPLQSSPPPAAAASSSPCRCDPNEIKMLRQQITDLQRRVEQAELNQDTMQQQNRLRCLLFSGSAIPEPVQNEDTAEVMRELI